MAAETKRMIELRLRIAREQRRMCNASVGKTTRLKAMARYKKLRHLYLRLGGRFEDLHTLESSPEQAPKKSGAASMTGVAVGAALAASLLRDARRANHNWHEAARNIKETDTALTRLEGRVAESVARLSELIS
ncbi:MAG: hypothetical protein Aurels2KO_25530 [Aureliella sp.]